MGKVLIGCYSFSSNGNYGTNHTSVLHWLGGAVKALDDVRKTKLSELEKTNAFQAIFVAPEYMFTDPSSFKTRKAMDEGTKNTLLSGLEGISNTYKETLIFPGTVFWKEPLSDEENLKKFQAQLVAATLDKGKVSDVVKDNRFTDQGVKIPSLNEASQAIKTITWDKGKVTSVTPGSLGYRAYNELYPLLNGKRWSPYLKKWDFKETEGANTTSETFIPGSSAGTKEIGGFDFGMEICFDHCNGALKAKNVTVDFHIVTSDSVDTVEGNMAMKDKGYFIHASSDTNETCVYQKNGTTNTKLTPTPAIQSNNLSWWLVDVAQKVATSTGIASLPKAPILSPTGKKLPTGAVKVMI